MNSKSLAILAAAAVVLGGAAYFLSSGNKPSASKLNGKAVLPGLSVADVARVEAGTNLVLAAGKDGWVVETYQNYPADRAKLQENLLKLSELKVGQVARGRKLGEERKVSLKDASGKVLATLQLGDRHMGKGGYYPDGRYLAFDGKTVLVKDALEEFDGDPKRWIETKIVDTPWISFKELADPKLPAETFGFATGVVAKVTIGGDTNRVATVGAAVKGGTDRYLKLDKGNWVYVVPSYSVDSLLPKPPPAKPEEKAEAKKPEVKAESK